MPLVVIHPAADSGWADMRLQDVLTHALSGAEYRTITTANELSGLQGQRLLFAVALGEYGINLEYVAMLRRLRSQPGLLKGCTAGLIVDGGSDLYTKSTAAELALALNMAGCALVGRPLVEATRYLTNFRIQAKNLGTDLGGAYKAAAAELVEHLISFQFPKKERPELLVLHAAAHANSNTSNLWDRVKRRLEDRCSITEIGLRNGAVSDCSGCPYTVCFHFGEKGSCFYGGVIRDEVYPAVRKADAIVMLCPNYNDALSANMTAFINRLTALFRQTRFYDKAVFAIVVSGYSGSDVIARQIISAMNMNKSFYLPGRFAVLETANNPGEAVALPGVTDRLDDFAQNILDTLCE